MKNPYDLGSDLGRLYADLLMEATPKKRVVAILSGRFQPFHAGHYYVYDILARKFGANNTYIGTSDKVEPPRSPFSFADKKKIITTLFSISPDKIQQLKSPFQPTEILSRFDPKTTVYVSAFGEKDVGRLTHGKYFREFPTNADIDSLEGYKDAGYYIVVPIGAGGISGTEVRATFSDPKIDIKKKEELFRKMYNGKFSKPIFDLIIQRISGKLTEGLLEEGVHDPGILKAVFMAGGPGSGKTYAASKIFGIPNKVYFAPSGLKVVNSDRALEYLLKKHGYGLDIGSLPPDVQAKITNEDDPNSIKRMAGRITRAMLERYKKERFGMILDATGRNAEKLQSQMEDLKKLGYDIKLVFVNTRLDVALARNRARERRLSDDMVTKIWNDTQKNLDHFKKVFGEENVTTLDNSDKLPNNVGKIADQFVSTPVQNPIGQQWIKQEKYGPKKQHPAEMPVKPRKQHVNPDARVTNPKTGRKIKVRTALGYEPEHPAHKAATQLVHAEGKSMISRVLIEKYHTAKWRRKVLLEGGAAGHLAHPFEDSDLTFGDLKKMIESGLEGGLNVEAPVTEKLDGQNISISYRKDKGVVFARNKSHIKDSGLNAMPVSGIKQMFAGRGELSDAFGLAADDLEQGILSLSDKQREKVFANGQKFMSVEIIYPSTQNVIPYGMNLLVFHNTIEFDKTGEPIGTNQEDARMLAGMIKQVNQNVQKTFTFRGPVVVSLPRSENFAQRKSYFLGKLSRIQGEYGLKDSDPLMMWHQRWWEDFITDQATKMKYGMPNNVLDGLLKRWAFLDPGAFPINAMKSVITSEDFLNWVLSYDKANHAAQFKKNVEPLEMLFLELGTEILENARGLISISPGDAADRLRKDLDNAVRELSSTTDVKKMAKVRDNLQKIQALGIERLVPSEGIVFVFKGKMYKLTGEFAPLNQILGALKY